MSLNGLSGAAFSGSEADDLTTTLQVSTDVEGYTRYIYAW